MNRDYSFRFFDDARMQEYMNTCYSGHAILEVFSDIKVPASRADIWRYCILLREGGVYCDIDSALRIPLRQLLRDDPPELISFEGNRWNGTAGYDFAAYSGPGVYATAPSESVRSRLEFPDHTVLNWLLCFEKGHPILSEAIDLIVRNASFFRAKKFDSMLFAVTHFTGPPALTQAVWRYIDRTDTRPAQCGIDFRGQGIFKLPGEEYRYADSPHYADISGSSIM